MAREPLTADAYLQIRRHAGGWRYEARAMKVTQRRPEVVEPDCIVVKIRVRIPFEAWDPIAPEAVIDVPAELTQHPVEVEATGAGQ